MNHYHPNNSLRIIYNTESAYFGDYEISGLKNYLMILAHSLVFLDAAMTVTRPDSLAITKTAVDALPRKSVTSQSHKRGAEHGTAQK